jgi:hypothetical protein
MRRIYFAVMLYLLLVTGESQSRGGTLPKALRRPFEVIDGRGNTGGVNLRVANAVLGVGAPAEDSTRPIGQR